MQGEKGMRQGILKISVVILMIAVAAACTTVYSGTGGLSSPGEYSHITGDFKQEFSASLDQTWQAILEALQALELTIVKRAKDQLGGEVVAKRADGSDVTVALRPRGLALTFVEIQVGGGNKEASIRIAQELERRLQK
ncbi:MAG: DUF3568 family protein [Candidatus Methylomirabilales bacterium]